MKKYNSPQNKEEKLESPDGRIGRQNRNDYKGSRGDTNSTQDAPIMSCPYCDDWQILSYVSLENQYTCKGCKNWFKPKQLLKDAEDTRSVKGCGKNYALWFECGKQGLCMECDDVSSTESEQDYERLDIKDCPLCEKGKESYETYLCVFHQKKLGKHHEDAQDTKSEPIKLLKERIKICHKDLLFAKSQKGYRKDWIEGFRSRLDELLLVWHELHNISFIDACKEFGIRYHDVDSGDASQDKGESK